MAASYPASAKSFTTKLDGAGNTIFASYVNDLQDEVVALETALVSGGVAHGLKPSVAAAQDLGTASLPWGTLHARILNLDVSSTLTIATGVVVAARSYHAVDTEGAAATDDLDTVTASGVAEGAILVLRAANVARVVTVKDGSGNLLLNGDCALSTTDATITLLYDGTNWRELARSVTTLPNLAYTLLHHGSGTSTAAGATTVDSFAVSGLTVKDSLLVVLFSFSLTQATATAGVLYSVTDSVALNVGANVNANAYLNGDMTVGVDQGGSPTVNYYNDLFESGGGGGRGAGTATLTTAWTGAWTLGLRHGGVTAGGTYRYRWIVYKRAGQ